MFSCCRSVTYIDFALCPRPVPLSDASPRNHCHCPAKEEKRMPPSVRAVQTVRRRPSSSPSAMPAAFYSIVGAVCKANGIGGAARSGDGNSADGRGKPSAAETPRGVEVRARPLQTGSRIAAALPLCPSLPRRDGLRPTMASQPRADSGGRLARPVRCEADPPAGPHVNRRPVGCPRKRV